MSGDVNGSLAELQRRRVDAEAEVGDKTVAAVMSELRVILAETEPLPYGDAKGDLVRALEDVLSCVKRLPGPA